MAPPEAPTSLVRTDWTQPGVVAACGVAVAIAGPLVTPLPYKDTTYTAYCTPTTAPYHEARAPGAATQTPGTVVAPGNRRHAVKDTGVAPVGADHDDEMRPPTMLTDRPTGTGAWHEPPTTV
jgi:hypothetical protein